MVNKYTAIQTMQLIITPLSHIELKKQEIFILPLDWVLNTLSLYIYCTTLAGIGTKFFKSYFPPSFFVWVIK